MRPPPGAEAENLSKVPALQRLLAFVRCWKERDRGIDRRDAWRAASGRVLWLKPITGFIVRGRSAGIVDANQVYSRAECILMWIARLPGVRHKRVAHSAAR